MEIAVILFGLLSIGCTWTIFMTISIFNKKIGDLQKAVANLHVSFMELDSKFKAMKEEKKKQKHVTYDRTGKLKEIIYKVPKEIKGDLDMIHEGKQALVAATFRVKETK